MSLLIQDFLREPGETTSKLADLKTRFGISARRHGAHANLVLLKYNMIESPFGEPIVRECRGVILDEAADWRVVSMAFTKFFNDGEGHAAPIDWATARVQEKLDGSLAVLYWYGDAWHVATSGTPDACGDVNGSDRFSAYFWRTFWDSGLILPNLWNTHPAQDHCFFFELTGPANRIVVVHEKPSLTLLGGRNLRTMQEIATSDAAALFQCKVPSVREFPLQSFEDIARSFEALSPLKQEGYVVVDAAFNRVKVKHPGYVALHHAKDGMTAKAFVEIARSGETSEVLVAFPEFRPLLDDASRRLTTLVEDVEADYARLRDIPEQKAFALEAVKTRCSAALFSIRAKKAESVRRYFATMNIDPLIRLLGYRNTDTAPARPSEAA